MAIHSIKSVQKIPAILEEVWDFYASHANLQLITPSYMKFKVISQNEGEKLHSGQIIEYKVRPILNVPLYWKTEIKNVTAPAYFMDEQLKGPYSIWQHQHIFKTIAGGTEMTDIVLYRNPLGPLGELANIVFIKNKLRNIFEFRFNKMVEIFGTWPGGQEMQIVVR
jgi:ligand-binding SRPBCC domain-containing protein